MFTVSAEPTIAFVDVFRAKLLLDSVLFAGGTNWRAPSGVYGHLSEAARTIYPYLVLGQRTTDGQAGAMQCAGNVVTLQLDGWSDAKGPYEIQSIGSRVWAVMERGVGFLVPGFHVVAGSLHREFGDYFEEPDEDKPGSKLYRMVQRWTVELHEPI